VAVDDVSVLERTLVSKETLVRNPDLLSMHLSPDWLNWVVRLSDSEQEKSTMIYTLAVLCATSLH
jgi:hypothetical protein